MPVDLSRPGWPSIDDRPPPRAPAPAPRATGPAVRVDGLVRRSVAGLIDVTLAGAVFSVAAFAMRWFPFVPLGPQRWNTFDYVVDEVNANLAGIAASGLLFLGTSLFVNLVVEVLAGASLGRLLLGSTVLDTRGRRASVPRLMLRNLFRALELPLIGLGLWVAFVLPSKRALHDLLSGTVVGRPQ